MGRRLASPRRVGFGTVVPKCAILVLGDDGALPLAKRRLGDAVAALADPVPLWADGVCRWTPSIYTSLRGSLRGSKTGRGGILRSAPCRIEILTLCVEIDTTVAGWEPGQDHAGPATPACRLVFQAAGLRADRCALRPDRTVGADRGRAADRRAARIPARTLSALRCGRRLLP